MRSSYKIHFFTKFIYIIRVCIQMQKGVNDGIYINEKSIYKRDDAFKRHDDGIERILQATLGVECIQLPWRPNLVFQIQAMHY